MAMVSPCSFTAEIIAIDHHLIAISLEVCDVTGWNMDLFDAGKTR